MLLCPTFDHMQTCNVPLEVRLNTFLAPLLQLSLSLPQCVSLQQVGSSHKRHDYRRMLHQSLDSFQFRVLLTTLTGGLGEDLPVHVRPWN